MRSTMSVQEGFRRSDESRGARPVQSWLAPLLAKVAVWRKHKREFEELARMSDQELADVRMNRVDVQSANRGWF